MSWTTWLASEGFAVDAAVAISEDPRARPVTRDAIKEDTVLFTINPSSLLSAETCSIAQVIQEFRDSAAVTQAGEEFLALTLAVMFEMQNSTSKWRVYLDSLPKSMDTPLFWTDAELKNLENTSIANKIGTKEIASDYHQVIKPFLEACPSIFQDVKSHYSLQQFKLIGSLVQALSFTDDETDVMFLAPLADALSSHSRVAEGSNVRLTRRKSGGYEMLATADIAASASLYTPYGDQSNADLLRKYGIVEDITEDDIVEVSISCLLPLSNDYGTPDLRQAKFKTLKKLGILEDDLVFVLENRGDLPEDFEVFGKCLCMNEKEFQQFRTSKVCHTIQNMNGLRKLMLQVIDDKLAKYPKTSTDKQEKATIADPSTPARIRHALKLRQIEKEILRTTRDIVIRICSLKRERATDDTGDDERAR